MKTILLTGATGYIGKRLLPVLFKRGNNVICCVRDRNRMLLPEGYDNQLSIIERFFKSRYTSKNPKEYRCCLLFNAFQCLPHPIMKNLEVIAHSFKEAMKRTTVQQVIYLSGIVNEEKLQNI